MTPATMETLNAEDVRTEALTWPERAAATRIADGVTYTNACELLKGIKALRGRIGETFDPHIRRALEAHRALVKEKGDAEAPLTEAERTLKRAIGDYDMEQERLRQEEERRQREVLRQQEEARRLEEAAALEIQAQDTGDALLREEAEQLISEPVNVPAPIVVKSTPKIAGISFRDTWSARVINLQKLVAYVGANPQFLNYVTPNATALNTAARAQKDGFKVPGVELVKQRITAAGSR